ncbi:hypothetical protein [Chryseobacterium sp. JAH]|uniref:hypothetical protein n=1 Tax=Chryseobacterium sp. JAH TaxID=1742858 RepID=UPI0007411C2B|nr:hypothetical protein [Chryseobacterium sp. JAH]KUJ52653.1 hypothetical protein AR685_06440 [Chryseobacterium sp. JAH]
MKNIIVVFFLLISDFVFSQSGFEKGEFITKDDEKIECLISKSLYRYAPDYLVFKKFENAPTENISTKNLKQFWVGKKKFIFVEVMIDMSASSNNIPLLSTNPNFENNLEMRWLEVLLTGKINLYKFYKNEVVRFFYKKESEKEIIPLNFKEYLADNTIMRNEEYKKQLVELFSGFPNISKNEINKLPYRETQMKKIFDIYNNVGKN